MKRDLNLAACALAAFVAFAPHGAFAAGLQAFAGVSGGFGNGKIELGCTTYGPPPELIAFFGGYAGQIAVAGGNAACGYSGGWTNLTSTGTTAPLTNSASLAPTLLGNPGFSGSFDGTASSRASYGSLGATTHGHIDAPPGSPNALYVSVAAATFNDTLSASVSHTYTDLSSAGFVRYHFLVEGGLSSPGIPAAGIPGEAVTEFAIQNDDGPIYGQMFAEAHVGSTGVLTGVPTSGGGWTVGTGSVSGGSVIESGMFSIDLLKSWDFKAGLVVNSIGNADDNFYNTAQLVGIDLFDSQGNAITDFTLSSASGTNYVSAVPEAPSAAFMIAGLLSLGGLRMRRGGFSPALGAGQHSGLA